MDEYLRSRAEKKAAWVREQIARAERLLASPDLPPEMRPNLERVLAILNSTASTSGSRHQSPRMQAMQLEGRMEPQGHQVDAQGAARARQHEGGKPSSAPQQSSGSVDDWWSSLGFYGQILVGFLVLGIFAVATGSVDGEDPVSDCYYYSNIATDCS